MSANFHPLVYIVDYILGIIMWTLVGRVAMNIFQREDSQFFFMKAFVKFTNPLLKIFKPLTPTFIIQPLVPLYVAWFFFMIRFYLMPYVLGYSVMGMLSFRQPPMGLPKNSCIILENPLRLKWIQNSQ